VCQLSYFDFAVGTVEYDIVAFVRAYYGPRYGDLGLMDKVVTGAGIDDPTTDPALRRCPGRGL
jgi:hypothetical protein